MVKSLLFAKIIAAPARLASRRFRRFIRRDDDGTLAAHVWARSGDVDVIGCEIASDSQLVTSFEAGASRS